MAAAMRNDDKPVIGAPYTIDGVAWQPADVPSLDEVGYAALLGDAADGRQTANGEVYVPGAISAAHRTLPMPSYVEVTALDTGRTILVRINDRGPMLNDRVIALSPGAARQLGIAANGTAAVRVRKVNPPEQERTKLRAGSPVGERMETPAGLRAALMKRLPAKPAPLGAPAPTLGASTDAAPADPALKIVPVLHSRAPARPPSAVAAAPVPPSQPRPAALAPARAAPAAPAARSGGYVVQLAALSSRVKADAMARSVGGFVMPVGSLFRVRTGPYASEASARGALGPIHAKGYAEARVVANDAR
ncbi:septal ring lytic transglycosylase RlpA family protein [Sphingobium sp. H33]|uniref:Endolytic peptidoglycan transglycosylase RlpA n=2 Tax=Sphingobium nicotianae TaxID=2782607 RepID=A0A9X1AK15_9SPHN|nr:septal ring lytic transglycosylase RlpA family protein [Sphingobium nicotianae]